MRHTLEPLVVSENRATIVVNGSENRQSIVVNTPFGGGVESQWVLSTGIWNDTEIWDDAGIWKDTP